MRHPRRHRERRVRRDGRAAALGTVYTGEGEGGAGGSPTTQGLAWRPDSLRAGFASSGSRREGVRRFEDRYEDALKELLKKKQSGQTIEAPRQREPTKAINLVDALRRSVETERAGGERRKPARAAGNHRAPKKAGRSSAISA